MVEMAQMRPIAIVLLLAALAYLLYLWSKRRDQINCPSCGANVDMYADRCPECGHEKGEAVETGDEPAEHHEGVKKDEVHVSDDLREDADEDAGEDASGDEEPGDADEEDADDDGGDAGDYTCDECGQSFESERGLKIHAGMKH